MERQIKIAMKHKKPLVFHLRGQNSLRAAKTILEMAGLPQNWPIHMHCFTDDWEVCQEWSQEWTQMKFGFTLNSFDPEVVKNLPLSRILLETDAPYFPPSRIVSISAM